MIEELTRLERPLLIFDTETTGPEPKTDRIVEIGLVRFMPDGTELEWGSLINPEMPIPREATFGNGDDYPGHGITDAMVQGCRKCFALGSYEISSQTHDADMNMRVEADRHEFHPWPTFRDAAPSLIKGFTGADLGGFNVKRFDVPLLYEEFKRVGIEWAYEAAQLLDGYRIWQYCESRTLSDASQLFLGRKHEGAHRALDDVRATIDIIRAQLRRYDRLPRSLDKLHAALYPKDPNAIDADGKIIWKDGEAVMNFGTKYKGVPLKKMARRDLDWIVNKATGLSPSLKAICRDAMFGKFPDQPKLPEVQ